MAIPEKVEALILEKVLAPINDAAVWWGTLLLVGSGTLYAFQADAAAMLDWITYNRLSISVSGTATRTIALGLFAVGMLSTTFGLSRMWRQARTARRLREATPSPVRAAPEARATPPSRERTLVVTTVDMTPELAEAKKTLNLQREVAAGAYPMSATKLYERYVGALQNPLRQIASEDQRRLALEMVHAMNHADAAIMQNNATQASTDIFHAARALDELLRKWDTIHIDNPTIARNVLNEHDADFLPNYEAYQNALKGLAAVTTSSARGDVSFHRRKPFQNAPTPK
ncbi:MAG: hypothetical protein WDA16_00265 [Candidatus Thermoplasmatota archaeon]